MYKRPPKHVERTRLMVLYSIMTLAVVSIVAVMVLLVANYRINLDTGTLEQRGLVQFASTPSAATVEIDDKTLSARTTTKSSVAPGEHRFAVWREGYETWILNTKVPAGSLVWLNYIRLVPKERPVETIQEYKHIAAAQPSPNSRSILLQPDASLPAFRLVDIGGDTPRGKTITLPSETYALSSAEQKKFKTGDLRFSIDSWDESSRYVTVWRSLGDARQLIVLDTQDPTRSVNVSQEFSIAIEAAEFAGRSGNVLYVKTESNIRKLDISGGTITRSLVSNVASFNVYDSDAIAYVSTPQTDTGTRTAGVYRDGDASPIILHTAHDEAAPVSIAVGAYYGSTYTLITEGSRFQLLSGHHDDGIDGMRVVASRTLDATIDTAEFNESGSHALLRTSDSFASFGIERKLFQETQLASGKSKGLFWIDTMHLGMIEDGVLTMRDIDGTNVFSLNEAAPLRGGATLSRNGTYMYSLGQAEDKIALQRIRMILR